MVQLVSKRSGGHSHSGQPKPQYPDSTPMPYATYRERSHWATDPNNAAREAEDLEPQTLATLDKVGLRGRLWQGVGDDPSSKGTHYATVQEHGQDGHMVPKGPAFDINMQSGYGKPDTIDPQHAETLVGQLRNDGVIAWYRNNTGPRRVDRNGNVVGNDFVVNHIHGLDPSVPNLNPIQFGQVKSYLRGGNAYYGSDQQSNPKVSPAQLQAFWKRVHPQTRSRLIAAGFHPPAGY